VLDLVSKQTGKQLAIIAAIVANVETKITPPRKKQASSGRVVIREISHPTKQTIGPYRIHSVNQSGCDTLGLRVVDYNWIISSLGLGVVGHWGRLVIHHHASKLNATLILCRLYRLSPGYFSSSRIER